MGETDDRIRELERYRTRYLQLRTVVEDAVTGLPSYAALVARLRSLLDTRRQIGVVHVDVADFGLIESLYGWQVFDRVLQHVAGILRDSVGPALPHGTLLAVDRAGGDRFVAFVPETSDGHDVDSPYLAVLCRVLHSRLERAFDDDEFLGLCPRLRFLTGHALLQENPYQRFERRVHSAVEEAREFRHRLEQRRELSSVEELKRIIEDGDVSTTYLPVVELRSGREIGWEALSRGPLGSMFEMPSSMFAMSGKYGIDVALDRLCRNKALRGGAGVSGRGLLFVNVLTDSLDDPEWRGSHVRQLLDDVALRPADVVLEVSERGIDADLSHTARSIAGLRDQGYRFALDDVGTGYASLSTLQELRPEFVKVDLSLVRGIDTHRIKQEALSSLLAIAGRLGSAVVAEGVETDREADALRELGVPYAEGFLFSHGAPGVVP